jgi:hypothetical protein
MIESDLTYEHQKIMGPSAMPLSHLRINLS